MEKIVTFAVPMAVTIPFTFLLCRLLIARKRRISFGTVWFSAFVVTFLWLGFMTNGDIYTVGFWHGVKAKPLDRALMLKVVAFMILTCTLPALGVAHYYQKRTKKDETTAA
jgi:hypothetical protein